MHRSLVVSAVFVAALLVAVSAAPAQNAVKVGENLVEVTVTGLGANKEDAQRDAQRKAVEQGAGTYIFSQSQTKDFALVKDTVLAKSAGFVQKVEVLSTKETDDGLVELKAKMTVSVKGIEDTWGVVTNLLAQMGRPKIMVFINEKIRDREKGVDEAVEDSTVQTRIQDLLLKDGFLLVDKNQMKEIDKKDLAAAAAEDSPAKVQAIAKRFGAQMFISGSAAGMPGVNKTINGVLFYTCEAEANVKTYRSDTAQLVSSIPGVATRGVQQVWRSAAKQALDTQAQQIAPRVVEDILAHWMDVMSGRGEVKLMVEGITFAQYVKLKKALGEVKQVKAVNATFANNIADCSLQAEVNAEPLAEKLVDAFKNLDITDVSQNVIKAKYKE